MSSHLLIDARHREETRVGVITENRLDEFDYESAGKVQIKGNVYLAKVTRVEPSLQAAFVEYGGNRQGFLAFSEIHPDYYQIPVEDRQALLAEEAKLAKEDQAEEANRGPENRVKSDKDGDTEGEIDAKAAKEAKNAGDDLIDEQLLSKRRARALKRRYKIQEVIKKRQVLLIQVVKEERGTKGAALTTYLSLPGRYCVLMPNTTHGNGISRKIGDAKERQRLRKIIETFTVPAGMGCIIRTAGMGRTKPEIKRDLDYLFKTWAEIRELTLRSTAPALIFEEGNLIKRALRDLYDKHIKDVLVEGKEGFEVARDFMKRLIPAHAKKVQLYEGKEPLFHKFGAEKEIDSLFAPVVTLPSGGYLVINPTEALVAIDVNSGKATKEHNIEETALQTNLEAAKEIARQLRLRDIAGLIVIDFIDMEYMGNVRNIERKFREALKGDKARIFTNRISALGLLEMSRQRLRSSLYEISTQPCPHCQASGRIPSLSTLALRVLRQAEDIGYQGNYPHVLIQAPQELALFILNSKRATLEEIEARYDITITITPSPRLRMPLFDVRGFTEDKMQTEIERDSTLAAFVLGDEGAEVKPEGFGKADGRGSFPGKKRKRGKRGGSHQRPAQGHFHKGGGKAPEGEPKPGHNKPPETTAKEAPKQDPGTSQLPKEAKPEDKKAGKKPHRRGKGGGKAAKGPDNRGPEKANPETKTEPKPETRSAAAEKPGAKPTPDKSPEGKTEAPGPAVNQEPKKETPAKKEPETKKEPEPKKEKTGPKKRGWWSRAAGKGK